MAIKNYLKDVKEITAPLNWKSSPDSPPTQLAYVTKPEIDLLVKANLHGSMNGKPNKGPKGIISLDGFGVDDEDSVVSQSTQQQYQQNLQQSKPSQQVGTSQSSFDQPGAVIPTVFQQQYQMEQDQDKPIPGVSFGITPEEAKQIKEEKEKQTLAEKGKDVAQGIMTELMGGGDGGNLKLTKEEAYAKLPEGMHPLRKQYEYLKEKYGPNWANTTQAKVLEGYLSGVPVERGGGLGAKDDTYGGGKFAEVDQFGNPIDPEQFEVAEKFRQQLLSSMGLAGSDIGGMNTMGTVAEQLGALSDTDYNKLRYGLSPEQFFNFNQQLMAADPSAGNEAYKAARPFSSGAGLGALASKFLPGATAISALAGGILPERDLSGFENYADYEQAGAAFRPLPVPDQNQNNQTGPIRPPGFMPIIPLPDPSQPERPRYPLPGDPRRPPFRPPFMPGTGIETVFNPMFLGPSFRGSPYTNRGVSPAFYEALSRFA
jgi:hypothetical protein